MKKAFRIIAFVLVALLFIGTFVFLYKKSQPKETEYELLTAKTETIRRTTVVTGSTRKRDKW